MKILKVTNTKKFLATLTTEYAPADSQYVKSIITRVREEGDSAVIHYENTFANVKISSLRLTKREIKGAYKKVSQAQIDAIRMARDRLEKTEKTVMSLLKDKTVRNDGITIRKRFVPVRSVGCYVPGGKARYPSSAIMSITPARVAGVERIAVVSPPDADGSPDPATVVAADMCGASEIYRTGGIQSIAALGYGTKSIQKVDKIVGPGGAFVTEAKSLVSADVGIDMLAGPTELGIIADAGADPKAVALDLISQAEHGPDTFCFLVTTSAVLADAVNAMISKLLPGLARMDYVDASLSSGFIAVCRNEAMVIEIANELAPEHLQIITEAPESIASNITTPGLVLLGHDTPSAASDYLLGSNHILPTSNEGRTRGSLSVLDFVKLVTHVSASKKSLSKISGHLEALTRAEGLPNHYAAVRGRLA